MDISWIIEQEKLEKIQKKCVREPFTTIELVSIYVNEAMEIETIEKDTMEINENQKVLDKEILNEWSIQKQKHTPKSIFTLNEILWFHIDLEPEQIQTIDEHKSYLQHIFKRDSLGIDTEIKLTPAIFIFHSLTTLFFIFQEETKTNHPKTYKTDKTYKSDKKKRTLRIVLPSKYKNSVRITRREKPEKPEKIDKPEKIG